MKKKALIITVALVLALSAISLAGCEFIFGSGNSIPQRYIVDVGEINDGSVASYVANNTVGSVVQIYADYENGVKSRSTGFFVTEDGYIVTNRHCVVLYSNGSDLPSGNNKRIDLKDLYVVTADNYKYDAEYVKYCPTADVAVIKIKLSAFDVLTANKPTFTPLEFDTQSRPYYGDTVFTMGNPENLGLLFTQLMVSCPAFELYEDDGYDTILLDGMINHGNSGGPLLDVNGHVVGLVYARVEGTKGDTYGIGCAISAKDVTDFLDSLDIVYSSYVAPEQESA